MSRWVWVWRRLRRSRDDEWGQPAPPSWYGAGAGVGQAPGLGGQPVLQGSGSPSILHPHRRRRQPRFSLGARLLTVLFLFLILFGISLYQVDHRFRPALGAMAEMKAKAVASQAINEALASSVFGDIRYDQLMDVKMDPEGKRVLLLQANGPELSRIAGRAQRQVWERLQQLNGQTVRVPVAQLLGWTLLANLGPSVHLTFHPTGATVTDIRQIFQSGGINQTQHIIYAHTTVTIRVLVPMVSQDVVVETDTFITAAVLNGEVPSFYMNGGTVMPQGQAIPPLLVPGSPLTPSVGTGATPGPSPLHR